jgi:hypothetical protein
VSFNSVLLKEMRMIALLRQIASPRRWRRFVLFTRVYDSQPAAHETA